MFVYSNGYYECEFCKTNCVLKNHQTGKLSDRNSDSLIRKSHFLKSTGKRTDDLDLSTQTPKSYRTAQGLLLFLYLEPSCHRKRKQSRILIFQLAVSCFDLPNRQHNQLSVISLPLERQQGGVWEQKTLYNTLSSFLTLS